MKTFNDSHLEVKKFFSGPFETHPYEVGWADEAIFFVMVEKVEGDPVMKAHVQLSQDGVHWADDDTPEAVITGLGQHIIKVNPNFGNYIRIRVDISGGQMFLNIHIACKG
ncbi:MAG: hypothetical protein MJZ09_00110 [Bacteroidales bacterium]|nr:hypothetical protein [Bacteroidales bacterium]